MDTNNPVFLRNMYTSHPEALEGCLADERRMMFSKVALAFVQIVLLAFTTPSAMAGGNTGMLCGRLVDKNGTPIRGLVTATSRSANETVRTDALGRYLFMSLPPDRYAIWAVSSAKEAADCNPIVEVAANEVRDVTLRVEPRGGDCLRTSLLPTAAPNSSVTSDVYDIFDL